MENSIFAPRQKIGRARPQNYNIELFPKSPAKKSWSSFLLSFSIAHRNPVINADPSEKNTSGSTTLGLQKCKSWTESVPIARSYDRHKLGLFSVKENDRKIRDFRHIIFRLYRRIFGFSLRG